MLLLSRARVHKVFAMSTSTMAGEQSVAQALKDVVQRVELASSKAGRAKPVRGYFARRASIRIGHSPNRVAARPFSRGAPCRCIAASPSCCA